MNSDTEVISYLRLSYWNYFKPLAQESESRGPTAEYLMALRQSELVSVDQSHPLRVGSSERTKNRSL